MLFFHVLCTPQTQSLVLIYTGPSLIIVDFYRNFNHYLPLLLTPILLPFILISSLLNLHAYLFHSVLEARFTSFLRKVKQAYLHTTLCHSYTEPFGYPSKLTIVLQTSTFVTFQWNELKCHEENGPITGYEYRLYHTQFHCTDGKVDRNTTTYTLYDTSVQAFSVAAINEAGIGEHCPPLQIPAFPSGLQRC